MKNLATFFRECYIFSSDYSDNKGAINSVGECNLHTVEVAGSNPASPTIFTFSRLRRIMNAKENIKLLLSIQKLDRKIHRLNRTKKELPARLKTLKDKLAAQQKATDEKKQAVKQSLVESKTLEVDLSAKTEQRHKLEVKLTTVRTNQEYKALEKEIFGIKADSSIVEDSILENMVATEKLQSEAAVYEEEIGSLHNQIREKENEIKKEIELADRELTGLNSERSTESGEIDSQYLKRYERISKRFPGTAIVPVIDRTCQGCHMQLTPQVIANIHNVDLFNICESCSRILYLPDEKSKPESEE